MRVALFLAACVLFVASAVALPLGDDWVDHCDYESLVCLNGGRINASLCQPAIDCPLFPPSYDNWRSMVRCECPAGWRGVACDIIDMTNPQPACGAYTPNGNPYTTSTAPLRAECFLDISQVSMLSLRDHRVEFVLQTPEGATDGGTIDMHLTSRHRNNDTAGECVPAADDLSLHLSQCQVVVKEGGDVIYTCLNLTANSCGFDPSTHCSAVFGALVKHLHPPISLTFSNIASETGDASAVLALDVISFAMGCSLGTCGSQSTISYTYPDRYQARSEGWVLDPFTVVKADNLAMTYADYPSNSFRADEIWNMSSLTAAHAPFIFSEGIAGFDQHLQAGSKSVFTWRNDSGNYCAPTAAVLMPQKLYDASTYRGVVEIEGVVTNMFNATLAPGAYTVLYVSVETNNPVAQYTYYQLGGGAVMEFYLKFLSFTVVDTWPGDTNLFKLPAYC